MWRVAAAPQAYMRARTPGKQTARLGNRRGGAPLQSDGHLPDRRPRSFSAPPDGRGCADCGRTCAGRGCAERDCAECGLALCARCSRICSADVPPERLYINGKGAFEFKRLVSRLTEMQSLDYLALAHGRVE